MTINTIANATIMPVVAPNARVNHPSSPPEPIICVASVATILGGVGGGGTGVVCSEDKDVGICTGFPQVGFGHLFAVPAFSSFVAIVLPQCGQLNRIIFIPL